MAWILSGYILDIWIWGYHGGSTPLASRHTQKMSDAVKTCANRACTTPQLPVKGDFCTAGKCKRARAALLASKKMCVVGVAAGGAALFAEDDGSQCFEVYAVYGVSRCDIFKLGAVQRHNELEKKDEHWSYEVYGKFGMTEDDNGYDDTRKVKLTELLKNLDDDSLKLLAKFDKGIEKKVGAEKKAILQKMAAEPEETEEAEGEDEG